MRAKNFNAKIILLQNRSQATHQLITIANRDRAKQTNVKKSRTTSFAKSPTKNQSLLASRSRLHLQTAQTTYEKSQNSKTNGGQAKHDGARTGPYARCWSRAIDPNKHLKKPNPNLTNRKSQQSDKTESELPHRMLPIPK